MTERDALDLLFALLDTGPDAAAAAARAAARRNTTFPAGGWTPERHTVSLVGDTLYLHVESAAGQTARFRIDAARESD